MVCEEEIIREGFMNHMKTDVLVCGGGCAGLVAAQSAGPCTSSVNS